MPSRIVTLNHNLADLQSRPRKHLLCSPLLDSTPVQVSATSIEFDVAYFYGYKTVHSGGTPTNNAGSVFLGEKDITGTYCVDEIAPGSVVSVRAATGTKLDLKNFWFNGASAGDQLFVKYQ
jgi:hypothetical protein